MIDPAYISIGANRSSSCAACFPDGVLAYGAGNTVALWDMKDDGRGVFATLIGHQAHVTTLKRIDEVSFISGDQAGEVRVWTREGRTFTCTAAFSVQKGSSISALAVYNGEILTGSSDGVVRRWSLEGGRKEVEKLDLKGKIPLDLIVGTLPGSKAPVLVMGLTDRKVQVWTLVNGSYRYTLSLEGHEDWVRCLALTPYPGANGADLLLATGAQDNYIRLWRISPTSNADTFDDVARRLDGSAQISTKAHVLAVDDGGERKRFNITLEALLVGHEAGLTNVNWSSATSPRLLSSASDNSLVIWSPTDGEHDCDGIWVPEHRFGAFGGRGLSFFGAVWAPHDEAVVATGWTGGVERWVRRGEGWETSPGVTGHFGVVQSVAWDPQGDYLLSTGSDQTSRIHAACRPSTQQATVWAEIARPQIHGYDMVDGAFLSPFRIVSAAEEKVTRVFEATTGFGESLGTLGVCNPGAEITHLPRGATVPPLGLSNRALGRAEAASEIPPKLVPKDAVERDSVSSAMTALPTEEELSTSTLWPEIEKVYGHGYELATLAASHAGDLLATACRASSAEHAVVRLVDARSWADVSTLPGHTLTVTRIAFSPDDRRLLTVSRDRGWRLFGRDPSTGWSLVAAEDRAHARMVLDCAWAGNDAFVTASRDKSVKLWRLTEGKWACAATHRLNEAATAVAVSSGAHLVAVGTESGAIEVLAIEAEVAPLAAVARADGHAAAVTRLAWRPAPEGSGTEQLASAGEDRAVRVFSVAT